MSANYPHLADPSQLTVGADAQLMVERAREAAFGPSPATIHGRVP